VPAGWNSAYDATCSATRPRASSTPARRHRRRKAAAWSRRPPVRRWLYPGRSAGTTGCAAASVPAFSPPHGSPSSTNGYVGAGAVTLANPGLKPELSTTADLGLVHADAAGNWEMTLFATRWQDKIATRIVDYGAPVVQQPQNVGEVIARGVEIQWSRRLAPGWSAAANYTHNRTRVVANAADPSVVGNELPDMPRHKANLSLAWEPDAGFTARAKLRAIGSAFTDDANTVVDTNGYRWKKAGHAVLDLAAIWRRPVWEFTLALNNALDREYVQGFFWRGEPRTLRAELTLRY